MNFFYCNTRIFVTTSYTVTFDLRCIDLSNYILAACLDWWYKLYFKHLQQNYTAGNNIERQKLQRSRLCCMSSMTKWRLTQENYFVFNSLHTLWQFITEMIIRVIIITAGQQANFRVMTNVSGLFQYIYFAMFVLSLSLN